MRDLPEFIVQDPPLSDPQMPAPFRFEGVDVQLFPVRARGEKLMAICDRMLNHVARAAGSPYRVEPLYGSATGVVNIQLLRYQRMFSSAGGYEKLGYSTQHELFFSIPVVLWERDVPVAVGVYVPYIFVDNALSLVTGRETAGFAKIGGEFSLPLNISHDGTSKVATQAAAVFSRNERIQVRPLLETRSVGTAPMAPDGSALLPADDGDDFLVLGDDGARKAWPYGPVDELYGSGGEFEADDRVQNLLVEDAGKSMGSYTLKQFRDAEHEGKACYQAIVGGRMDMLEFYRGGLLRQTEITVYPYASLKIVAALGLEGRTIKPIYGFWFRADLQLHRLTNLVVRTASKSAPQAPPQAPRDCLGLWLRGAHGVLDVNQALLDAWRQALGAGKDRR